MYRRGRSLFSTGSVAASSCPSTSSSFSCSLHRSRPSRAASSTSQFLRSSILIQNSSKSRLFIPSTTSPTSTLPTVPFLPKSSHRTRTALTGTALASKAKSGITLAIRNKSYSGWFSRGKPHPKSRPLWKQLWELRKTPVTIFFFGAVFVFIPSVCAVYYYHYQDAVPYTDRQRLMDISAEEEQRLGILAFHELRQQFRGRVLPVEHRHTQAVARVASAIIRQTDIQYLDWEFFVIDSPEVNAFVIPGGKVFVYTGILDVLHDEQGMATCLAHEIAHVVARHGVEKWSKARLTRLFSAIASMFSGSVVTVNLFEQFALQLPFSRKLESEADYIGLILLAKACYDPNRAVELWERMQKLSEKGPPQYLSTHPSHENRIEKIKKWLPKARAIRVKSCDHVNPDRWFAHLPEEEKAPGLTNPAFWKKQN